MTFEVPAAKASIKQNVFEFTIPGSKKVYSLPLMQYIGADLAHQMTEFLPKVKEAEENGGIVSDPELNAALNAWQHDLFERYAPGIYGRLSRDQVEALAEAWREASAVSLGESSSSSES